MEGIQSSIRHGFGIEEEGTVSLDIHVPVIDRTDIRLKMPFSNRIALQVHDGRERLNGEERKDLTQEQ